MYNLQMSPRPHPPNQGKPEEEVWPGSWSGGRAAGGGECVCRLTTLDIRKCMETSGGHRDQGKATAKVAGLGVG